MPGAYEEAVLAVSIDAGEDLSDTGIYRFGKVNSSGKVVKAGAGERSVGVILTKPGIDHPTRVGLAGIVPIELGGSVTAGGEISSGALGVGVAQSSTNPSYAVALASGSSGEIIPALLLPQR